MESAALPGRGQSLKRDQGGGRAAARTLHEAGVRPVQGRGGAGLSLVGCLQQAVAGAVILSAAKDLRAAGERFFAALRMTGSSGAFQKTYQ